MRFMRTVAAAVTTKCLQHNHTEYGGKLKCKECVSEVRVNWSKTLVAVARRRTFSHVCVVCIMWTCRPYVRCITWMFWRVVYQCDWYVRLKIFGSDTKIYGLWNIAVKKCWWKWWNEGTSKMFHISSSHLSFVQQINTRTQFDAFTRDCSLNMFCDEPNKMFNRIGTYAKDNGSGGGGGGVESESDSAKWKRWRLGKKEKESEWVTRTRISAHYYQIESHKSIRWLE